MKKSMILAALAAVVLSGCAGLQQGKEFAKQAQDGVIQAQEDLAKARAVGICRMPANVAPDLFPSAQAYCDFVGVCRSMGIHVLPEGVLECQ